MFLDEARILAASGKGGDGVVHFRREKFVPRGGPDGGDGGKGGDVILEVDPNLNTLASFRHQRHFRAEAGGSGGGSNKTGRSGGDCLIRVPPGTVVKDDETGQVIGDLVEPGQRLVVCKGGRGGRGNARFACSKNQAPRMAEKGEPGVERWLQLELRLIADVGIVGMPNAGKSTFLAAVSNARPKIAAYPFTTLQPNLGVVELDLENVLVLADIPGLIEGAHAGSGLGFQFLRHVRRTRVLLHLIDGMSQNPLADFSQVNAELALYDEALSDKRQIVAVNKLDIPEARSRWPEVERRFQEQGHEPFGISALAREGLREVLYAALHALQDYEPPPEPEPEELPVYRVEADPETFKIARTQSGDWRVMGEAVERAAAMTYWEYDESVRRFQRLLERMGIEEALRRAGASSGDTVLIGEYELEWQE
jgi:GTP-binding protein